MVLVVTIILSGLVVVLGLGLMKTLTKDIQFAAHVLRSEQAYFAAESGVEKALLELKSEPVQWMDGLSRLALGDDVNNQLHIGNRVDRFSFTLGHQESEKMRLRKDRDQTFSTDISISNNVEIAAPDLNQIQWKVLCQTDQGSQSLQGDGLDASLQRNPIQDERIAHPQAQINEQRGSYDHADNRITQSTFDNFWSGLSDGERASCFLSLTNVSNDEQSITITNPDFMAPHRALVRSVGTAGGRQKIIEFFYRQKNLSPLFNFGIVHYNEQ